MKHRVDVLISESEVQQRIAELGQAISARYQGSEELVLIGLLRGSCVFLADLCREITVPVSFDFMTASSYGNSMNSSREVRILKDLDDEIKGKDVLIVEDIIDSGLTLSWLLENFASRGAASVLLVENDAALVAQLQVLQAKLQATGVGRGGKQGGHQVDGVPQGKRQKLELQPPGFDF